MGQYKQNISVKDLNEYCLRRIFDFLTIPERWIAGQVCEDWKTVHDGSLYRAKILHTSEHGWAHIFKDDENENMQIAKDIIEKYGRFINRLEYHCDRHSELVPIFPCKFLLDHCSDTKLEYVKISNFGKSFPIVEFISRCRDIVELKIDVVVDSHIEEFANFVAENVRLKSICMTVLDEGMICLINLMEKPIEELEITIESQNIFDALMEVLRNLRGLKILGITYNIGEDLSPNEVSVLEEVLSVPKLLNKLRIEIPGAANNCLRSLNPLEQLMELNIQSDQSVTDEFLSQLGHNLPQLKSLNISGPILCNSSRHIFFFLCNYSLRAMETELWTAKACVTTNFYCVGCYNFTDQGLMALRYLEELYVEEVYINGQGLMVFVKLKRLSCRGSSIFDIAVCHILNACLELEFLNLSGCINVTMTSLDSAINTIADRRNKIVLKMILDLELIYHNRIQIPSLLQLFSTEFVLSTLDPWDSHEFNHLMSTRNVGTSYYVLEKTTTFVALSYLYTTNLNFSISRLEDCILNNILRFISVIKRIRLKRVSKGWAEMIKKSWENLNKLDLTTPEWKFLQFTQPMVQINGCIDTVLGECGKNLKSIVISDAFGINSLPARCQQLKTMIFRGDPLEPNDITFLAVSYSKLTEIRMNVDVTQLETNSLLFSANRNLKSLFLQGGSIDEFGFLANLNPVDLETLQFNLYISSHMSRTIEVTFLTAFARLENLKTLIAKTEGISIELLTRAIVGLKKLAVLMLESDTIQDSQEDFTCLYNMKQLKMLALKNYLSVNNDLLIGLCLNCPFLSHIDISGCKSVTDDGLRIITTLPNLHTLIMKNLSTIKGDGLSLLYGSTFRHLECQMCYSMTTDPICNVISNCSNLKFLNIVRCIKLNQRVIDVAIETTNLRDNGVKLKLISDSDLVSAKRGQTTPLLDVTIYRIDLE